MGNGTVADWVQKPTYTWGGSPGIHIHRYKVTPKKIGVEHIGIFALHRLPTKSSSKKGKLNMFDLLGN